MKDMYRIANMAFSAETYEDAIQQWATYTQPERTCKVAVRNVRSDETAVFAITPSRMFTSRLVR